MDTDRVLKLVEVLKNCLRDMWRTIEEAHLSHRTYLDYRRRIFSGSDYEKLPRWAKEYLRGYDMARYDAIDTLIVYSYVLNGKRVTLGSPEWQQLGFNVSDTVDTTTGCYVWREDTSKVWA
jgi:hypothetical protein